MTLADIFPLYEEGRIVKGVNTTPDVGPNEIVRQAAKWGFKVNKDGVPVKCFTTAKPQDLITKPD